MSLIYRNNSLVCRRWELFHKFPCLMYHCNDNFDCFEWQKYLASIVFNYPTYLYGSLFEFKISYCVALTSYFQDKEIRFLKALVSFAHLNIWHSKIKIMKEFLFFAILFKGLFFSFTWWLSRHKAKSSQREWLWTKPRTWMMKSNFPQ